MTHTPQHPTARPGTTRPGTAQPGTAQPGTAQPGTAQPGTAQSDNPLATTAGPTSPNPATVTPSAGALTAAPVTAPGPAQPTVPLAVWSTPVTATTRPGDGQPGGVWTVPPLLAQHLLAVYTAPGGTVLAVGGSARTLARTAVRLDRRPPARGSDRRAAAGSVDLLVLTPAPGGPAVGTGSGLWRRWPHLLAPAGVLAVVLPPTRAPGDPAAVIAAAAGAGLTYLQHAVAVLWPLHDDHLDPPTHPDSVPRARGELPAAHADVLLFTPGQFPGPEAEADTGPDGRPVVRPSSGPDHEGVTR